MTIVSSFRRGMHVAAIVTLMIALGCIQRATAACSHYSVAFTGSFPHVSGSLNIIGNWLNGQGQGAGTNVNVNLSGISPATFNIPGGYPFLDDITVYGVTVPNDGSWHYVPILDAMGHPTGACLRIRITGYPPSYCPVIELMEVSPC